MQNVASEQWKFDPILSLHRNLLEKRFFEKALNDAYQKEWGRTVAYLIKRTGDISAAEDYAQGAFESAIQHW